MGSGPGGKLKLRLLYGALSATLLVAPAMLGVSAIQVSAAKGGVNDAHPAGASNASSAPATSNAGGNGNAVAGANSNAGNAVAGANSNASANGATNGVGSDKQADALSSGTAAATSSSSTVSSAPVSAPAAAKPAGGIDPKGGSGGAGNGNLPAPNKTGPGDKNKGDVWVDTVGAAPGPGHEMDPHLPCADINLWGAGLADTSGTFTIDGWPPSGHKAQAYPASGTLPWNYTAGSGTQNLLLAGASDPYTADADIDVDKLLANAKNNGDAPVNKQGFHFKLQFSQDPQKHKTFWVDCPPPPPPPHPVDCDGDTDNSVAATDTACQPAKPTLDCDNDTDNTTASECSAVQPVTTTTTPTTPVSHVQAATTPASQPASQVLAASVTMPVTGLALKWWMLIEGALVVLAGAGILALSTRRQEAS